MSNDNRYKLIMYNTNPSDGILVMSSSNLEEIDAFTMEYNNCSELIDKVREERHISGNYKYLCISKKKKNGGYKPFKVLYKWDFFDSEKVVGFYTDYILEDINRFNESPARFVNLSCEDYSNKYDYVKLCLMTYFKTRNYRNIRGAYLILKSENYKLDKVLKNNNGLLSGIEKYGRFTDSSFEKESDDEYLEWLLNDKEDIDWDKIYGFYDADELEVLIRRKSGGRRR